MIYLIACPDSTLAISLARNAIKKELPVRDEFNFVSFNMADTPLLELSQEAGFLPLGYDKKAIIAQNCYFLEKQGKGSKKMMDGLDDLKAYLEHPAEFTDLYLLVYSDKLDEKSPLYEAIKKNGHIQIEKAPDEAFLRKVMNNFLAKRGIKIEEAAARELLSRVGNDYARLSNELRKLDIYVDGEDIRLEAVKLLVNARLEDNVFQISEALLNDNVKKALSAYYDLKVLNTDEVSLISILATQFRFADQVSYLDSMGRTKREIASILSANEWRVGKTLQTLYGVKRETIARIIEQLYEADKMILTGSANPEFAFTRFLANFSLD